MTAVWDQNEVQPARPSNGALTYGSLTYDTSYPAFEACDQRFQPFRPLWPRWRNPDARPVDEATVELPSRDHIGKTKNGTARYSSGIVRFSAIHAIQLRSDAEMVLAILHEVKPHMSKMWTLSKLQKAFSSRAGRPGSWERYKLSFVVFLSIFPRTFELLRDNFVRPLRSSTSVADHIEEVMKSLALARHTEYVQACSETPRSVSPAIQTNSVKATYLPVNINTQLCGVRSRPESARSTRADSARSRPSTTSTFRCRPMSARR